MFSKKFYLKLLMSLMLMALTVPQLKAETVTISKGDVSNKSEVPFWTSYGDYGYHGQMIYSQGDLADLPSGATITAITFSADKNIVATGGSVNTPFVIKMGEPTNAVYESASFVTENLTTVSTTADIWSGTTDVTINFTTPYTYNGGNLLVDLLCTFNSQGQYNTSPIYWKTYTSTNSSCYARGNSSGVLQSPNRASYLPVITITYEVSTDPTIKVDPETVTINTDPYTAGTGNFTVTGTNLTNNITLSVQGSGFSVNPTTITAAEAANGKSVLVTYSAQEAGTFDGTITLSSEGAESKTVNVTANVVQPVISGTVTPTSLNFETYANVAATKTISIENTGNRAFTPAFTVAAPFSIAAATEIAVGETKTFDVTYTPTAVGTDNGTLTVTINGTPTTVTLNGTATEAPKEATLADGTERNNKLPVYGYYYDNASNNYNQMIYPASMIPSYLTGKKITSLTFYSSGLKFSGGNLAIRLATTDAEKFESTAKLDMPSNAVSQNFVHHANEALDPITVTFDEPFKYNGGNIIIETQVTTVGTCDPYNSTTYQPDYTYFYGVNTTENYSYCAKGSYGSAQLLKFLPKVTFAYEDSETPVITVDPATVDAFTTEVGTPVTKPVNVTGENLTGAITATVSGDDAFTAVLENGVLTITYNPTAAGNHTATVTLSSTGAQDVTIALTGTATEAQPYAVTVNPENGYDFGNVLVDNTKVWTITVTNNGTESVTPTLTGLEAPFSTTYTAAPLAAGESVSIEITFAPTELNNYNNAITLSFPEAGEAIAAYTFELTGKGVDSFEPTADNEVVKLITVDKRSIYEPNFIDAANNNTTPQQLNCYDMRFKMAQPDDPTKQIKAGDLHPGNNLYEFYAIDDFGTEFRFATINLYAEGQPSSNPSVSAMDAPIVVTPSVEYYTEEGMPVHPTYTHNTTLNYTEKTYNNINELVDLEGVIDYVNDTWSANTATNSHPDHYKFQIRGVGQYGDLVTSLTAEYVESHMTGPNNSLVLPTEWERGSWVGPNNEIDGVHTFYYYDLYIKRSFFDERGITGPVTVVVNTTLSGSGFNADNYKAMSVNGVEQIIAKEAYKDYSWTVPLGNDLPENTVVEQVPMGVVIRLISTGADFNKTTGIYIYGGGTGVSNIDIVGIYKSSMNVKAYTQKQVDEDTDRNLVAMKVGNTETANADVNVLAYGDAAVTGYKLYENSSASTTGMSQVATATHNSQSYTVNSVSAYTSTYPYVRDESLGNVDGMWLPMYPADPSKYFLPVTIANGVGDDGVIRSEGNTYGSAMQQVEKNGSVDFATYTCFRSKFTWSWENDNVTYAIYNPYVILSSELPAATGYQFYNYRLWVDYDEDAPAWDFVAGEDDGKIHLTTKMDRPLYSGTNPEIGGEGTVNEQGVGRKDNWAFVAPADLEEVKLVARFYYKKNSTSSLKARPTDKDRLYYVVEKQVTLKTGENIITGIEDVTNKTVADVKYYNLMGVESNEPFNGVNIVVTRYTDGSISTSKVLK